MSSFAITQPSNALADALRGSILAMATAFTNAGAAIVANRVRAAGTAPNHVHWGTGTTAAAVGQTALVTPGTEARVAGTETSQTVAQTGDTYQVVGNLVCNATGKAITEAGLFDASTAGNMLIRSDFTAINVAQNDSIQFTFRLQFLPSAA